MEAAIANSNYSSVLSQAGLSCTKDCPLRSNLTAIMKAHDKECNELRFEISLRNTAIEHLLSQGKVSGEKAEHLQELLRSFQTSTFSGSSMRLTDAQLRSYIEQLRKEESSKATASGKKEDPGHEQKGTSTGNDQHGGTPPGGDGTGTSGGDGAGTPGGDGAGTSGGDGAGTPGGDGAGSSGGDGAGTSGGDGAGTSGGDGAGTSGEDGAGTSGGDGAGTPGGDGAGSSGGDGAGTSGGDGVGTPGGETSHRGRPLGSTGSFIDHIPEEDRVDGGTVGLPDQDRICPVCGSIMEPVGSKEQESLSLVPAHFVLRTTRYITYRCKSCKQKGIDVYKYTPRPDRFLFHSVVEPEVVAHFAVQKLNLGVPMNTQARDHVSRGIPISRQDISNYMTRAGELYAIPVARGIERHIMRDNDVIFTDETFDKNIKGEIGEDGKKNMRRTIWVFKVPKGPASPQGAESSQGKKYPGTVYSHGGPRTKERLKETVHDFLHTPVHDVSVHDLDALDDQQKAALKEVLRICEPNLNNRMKSPGSAADDGDSEETFEFDRAFDDSIQDQMEKDEWFREAMEKIAKKKLMHSDGYTGYHYLFNTINSGCNCHGRAKEFRGFVSCRKREHREILLELLLLHQDLFRLEKAFKDFSPEERFRERLRRSFPILQQISEICEQQYSAAQAAGGLFFEAIRYIVNQKPYLYAFLLDGRLEISNNLSERAVKVYARLRRNSLFHASDLGGDSDCAFLTILTTAPDWDLVPEKYLTWVLREAAKIRPEDSKLLKAGDWVEPLLPHNAPDWCKVNYQPTPDATE